MASLTKIIYLKWRFRFKHWFAPKLQPEFKHLQGKKKCFVMLAADYGNLGDVAITYAQEQWLAEHYPDHDIVDVPISKTLTHLKALQHISTPEDIITIVGGGNMSDLYFDIELFRQMVVKAFPNNRVISFPQTMFFSDTPSGRYLKRCAQKVYSRHKQLTLTARERHTYELMQKLSLKSILVPDIVMTLDKREPDCERKGITLCFRNDAESKLPRAFIDDLRNALTSEFEIKDYDTHIGRSGLTVAEREQELNKIWSQFRSSEWIITDRLHGMIFAFITGTPAIVFANNNNKIESCYEWIKGCGYVHYIDDNDLGMVLDIMRETRKNGCHKDGISIKTKFNKLWQE